MPNTQYQIAIEILVRKTLGFEEFATAWRPWMEAG